MVKLNNGFLLDEGQRSLPKFQVRFPAGVAGRSYKAVLWACFDF